MPTSARSEGRGNWHDDSIVFWQETSRRARRGEDLEEPCHAGEEAASRNHVIDR